MSGNTAVPKVALARVAEGWAQCAFSTSFVSVSTTSHSQLLPETLRPLCPRSTNQSDSLASFQARTGEDRERVTEGHMARVERKTEEVDQYWSPHDKLSNLGH